MTEKLYNRDADLCSFDARVLSVTAHERGFLVETDATAFFPEGGGQGADAGTLGTYRVLDVQEREGRIFHLLDGAPAVGACVHGEIDFSLRFERMQCHTGEHIVSGILHSLYGAENVGFHLGDIVTLDIDRVVDRAALDKVEDLASGAFRYDRSRKAGSDGKRAYRDHRRSGRLRLLCAARCVYGRDRTDQNFRV